MCLLLSAPVALTGCGAGAAASADVTPFTSVSGLVHGGQQPVSGAAVTLYSTTVGSATTPYAAAPITLATATSKPDGSFVLVSNGTACPAATATVKPQTYIIVTGGNPGLTAGTNNTGLVLMAALGPCGSINGNTGVSVVVNELTTVAAAYAMSGFMPAGGAGFVTGSITSSVATSPTNAQGLMDAVLNANNLVPYATGQPNTTTAFTVPTATIISLGNILSACVNTGGSTSSGTACNSLYAAATPPAGSGVSAPVNTLQAALDIAAYPGNNVGTSSTGVFGVAPTFVAFSGGLSSPPNDWTLSLSYTAANLQNATGMAIDNTDNVYTVGYNASTGPTTSSLLEFSPQGTLLSPAAGWNSTAASGTNFKATDNVREIKIDPSGNLFLADGAVAQIIEYTPAGTATAPTAGTFTLLSYSAVDATKNNWGLAVDTAGDVFSSSYKASTCVTTPSTSSSYCGLVEFPAGTFASPVSTFGTSAALLPYTTSGPRDLAVDTGNKLVYGGTNQTNQVVISNYAAGTQNTVTLPTCASPYGVALDGSATPNAYVAGFGNYAGTTSSCTSATAAASQLYVVNNTSGGTLVNTIGAATTVGVSGSTNGTPFSNAFYDVVDGNGNVFVTNSLINGTTAPATSSIAEYSPSFNTAAGALLSNNLGFSPGATYVPATTGSTPAPASLSGGTVINARSIAIDRSGAMWVLNPGATGQLVQIFGASAPTSPVLALGGYGVKP